VPRYQHIAKTYSSSKERIVHITKKKKQIDTMSDSGANQDELVKQINGIIKSGKVTEEEMQAWIESLAKKNK
jgi:capsular polysaccharide biosynthesis protein